MVRVPARMPLLVVVFTIYETPLCELRLIDHGAEVSPLPWVLPVKLFVYQVALCSNMLRMWPIALVGLRPLGQTLTQFMMPRQRNTLNGSSSEARRSSVLVSRLSAKKR